MSEVLSPVAPLELARCASCSAPLAEQQRYCVECGARRGPLPATVAAVIAGAPAAGPIAALDAPGERDPHDDDPLTAVPAPSAWQAAVTIMALLGFGTLVGGVAAPSIGLAYAPPAAPAVAAAPAATVAADAPSDAAAEDEAAPGAAVTEVPAVDIAGEEETEPDPEPAPATPAPAPASTGPEINHAFVVMLSGQGYDGTFSPTSASTYFNATLPKQGELLQNYYAVSQSSLSNTIALISGQGPTPETLLNCPTYADLQPGTAGADGQTIGTGCIFPASTRTLGDQLREAGSGWKAYIGGMGSAGCRHPDVGSGDAPDAAGYATWKNPFAYFHSTIDADTCADDVVDLGQLDDDLKDAQAAPALAYIVPDRCHDGSADPCTEGAEAGLGPAEAFLEDLLPKIERSAAYEDNGLIVVTFDGAPLTGDGADNSGCCQMPVYPNAPLPTTPLNTTPGLQTEIGGGRVGALLISKYVEPGSTNTITDFNHFSLLKTLENLFELDHVGYAAMPTIPVFDKQIWNAKSSSSSSGG